MYLIEKTVIMLIYFYFVAILMHVKRDKIQSEKENLTFLTLCFIHTHDCTCAIVKISSAFIFAWLKITLFLCFQMHQTIETHRLFHSLLPSWLKHTQENCSKWWIKSLWSTELIPVQLKQIFQTLVDTSQVTRMCEVESSSLPHKTHIVSPNKTPLLCKFVLVAILFDRALHT